MLDLQKLVFNFFFFDISGFYLSRLSRFHCTKLHAVIPCFIPTSTCNVFAFCTQFKNTFLHVFCFFFFFCRKKFYFFTNFSSYNFNHHLRCNFPFRAFCMQQSCAYDCLSGFQINFITFIFSFKFFLVISYIIYIRMYFYHVPCLFLLLVSSSSLLLSL